MGYVAKVGDVVKSPLHTYTIVKEINKGGFADAYKAIDEVGTTVFLKQYKSPSKLVPWFNKYFKYEQELNRRLKEDMVLKNASVYANEVFLAKVYKSDGTPWTRNECLFQTFPFITGNTNLNDMIEKGAAFDWEKRMYACTVFAFALRKLHDADVIHCDLKPENVQVMHDDTIAVKYRPLLVDMDWSILSDKTAPWDGKQGYVGTVGYNSPEHLQNKAPLEASDVFTAAIIMCQVLANHHPFVSHLGEDDLTEYVLSGKNDFANPNAIPFMGPVTDKFRTLIFNALSVKPGNRPTMAEIHMELMTMCKMLGKVKAPGPIDTFKAKERAKREAKSAAKHAMTAVAKVKEEIAKKPKKPYVDASMVDAGKGTSSAKLTLSGDLGSISTKMNFIFDQATLKRISSDARFADSVNQFKVSTKLGVWKIEASPTAANDTLLNGKILSSSTRLNTADVICLKSKTGSKTAMKLNVVIG